jgi:hypothetical protein
MTYCTQYTSVICEAPPEDEQVTLETFRGPWFSLNWMKSPLCWFHYTDILYWARNSMLLVISIVPYRFYTETKQDIILRQTSPYHAIPLDLYKIRFHIIFPSFLILPSRFYPHFTIKYKYACLQIFFPIPYLSLLHIIPIRNTACWLQPIKILFTICNAIPTPTPSYSKIYQLLPYVTLDMTNWLFGKHLDCRDCGLPQCTIVACSYRNYGNHKAIFQSQIRRNLFTINKKQKIYKLFRDILLDHFLFFRI